MKIRLLKDIPFIELAHGMTKGRELEVIRHDHAARRANSAWVMGDAEKEVQLWRSEYEILPDPPEAEDG